MSWGELPAVKPVRHWTGQFIWCEGEAKPYHFYLFARRNLELDAQPKSAELHITASDRYLLYVNGTYLGRGPARSDPRRKSYDTYEVAEHLQPGKNTISVRAYHYGTAPRGTGWGSWSGNAYTVGERAGLWVQLDLANADGQTEIIGTDERWRLRPARAWNRDVQEINCLVGAPEVYDASADPVDWMATDFDDSGWEPAWVIPQPELEWFLLEAREIPLLREQEVFPARVVDVGEVIDMGRPGQVDIPELLNEEIHFPLEHAVAKDADAVLQNDGRAAEFQGRFAGEKGIRAPYVILDFGRQLFGFPRVRLRAEQGAMLDMTYGQQLVGGRIPPALRYGDRYIARDGEQTWEVAEYKQFRYLHITLHSTYAPIEVESVSVNEYTYPAKRRGRFECSDPLLTKLWKACLDTTYLNLEDTLVHEGYRERAVWATGDGSHIMHMVFAAYGDLRLTDRFLRIFPLSERGDGMLQTVYPPDNPERYLIPQFLLQWSTRVLEHYLFTGRAAVLQDLYRSVPAQIDWYEPHRDETGLLRDLPLQNWLDWVPTDLRGASFVTNALYVKALEDAATLAELAGSSEDAERWRRIAGEVRQALRELLWNADEGLYEDSLLEGQRTGVASELANGFALLYGIAADDQVPQIARHFGPDQKRLVAASPLYFGYVAEGLFTRGEAVLAEELTRTRFRPMLEATDNPTIWEGWGPFTGSQPILTEEAYRRRDRERPAGVRSLAHTGGVLIGYVLSTRVLGVMPTAPGFARCTIRPDTGDLEWAQGVFPAPRGDIRVEWQKTDGKLSLQTEVPEGIEAEVVLDRTPDRPQSLSHNGASTDLQDLEAVAAAGLLVEPDAVRIRVQGGSHTFELTDLPD